MSLIQTFGVDLRHLVLNSVNSSNFMTISQTCRSEAAKIVNIHLLISASDVQSQINDSGNDQTHRFPRIDSVKQLAKNTNQSQDLFPNNLVLKCPIPRANKTRKRHISNLSVPADNETHVYKVRNNSIESNMDCHQKWSWRNWTKEYVQSYL